MAVVKVVFLGLILINTGLAVENQTMDLEQHLKIQKREKQYLIEDDPSDEPVQKREERQCIPNKMNQVDPKVQSKMANVRLQPKILPTSLKPGLNCMQKPVNLHIDTTPQKIPTKIPVILKNTKVVPNAAHNARVKMIDNIKNTSTPNKDLDLNTNNEHICVTNKEDPLSHYKEDNIPFTIEDKGDLKTEDQESVNKVQNQVNLDLENKETLNKEDRRFLSNKESEVTVPKDEHKEDIPISAEKEEVNLKTNSIPSLDFKRKYHFLIDEAEPLPPLNKDSSKPEDKGAKNMEASSRKVINNNTKKDNIKQIDLIAEDQADNAPKIIQILNGTHIISIKKIPNHEKLKIQELLSPDGGDESELQIEERIINKKPQKPTNENVLHGGQLSDSQIKDDKNKKQNIKINHIDAEENKYPNDCITIINHDYEEIKEKTPILNAVPASACYYDDGCHQSWNYPQNIQSLYCNLYNPNICDQYRQYYDETQNDPNAQIQENDNLYTNNPECSQSYYKIENQPIYSHPYYPNQVDIDTLNQEPQAENTLDRIWRAWKDVEIKIRNSQNNDVPIDIDIKRNIADSSSKVSNSCVAKLPYAYVNRPNALNGYYNNQNSAMYPYMNHRYVH